VVFVQRIFVNAKPIAVFDDIWMVAKARLDFETLDRGKCGSRRTIDPDRLDVFLPVGKDVNVLNNKDGL